jgi:hypothetical protein
MPAATPADSSKCRLEIRDLLWFSTLTPPLTPMTETDYPLSGPRLPPLHSLRALRSIVFDSRRASTFLGTFAGMSTG